MSLLNQASVRPNNASDKLDKIIDFYDSYLKYNKLDIHLSVNSLIK